MISFSFSPLSIETVLSAVKDPEAGGNVLFIGSVRSQTEGKTVTTLEYEAYQEMAIKQFEYIEQEIKDKWEIKHITVIHRLGKLCVGEISIIIAVSAPHRDDAFQACRYAIEGIKKDVPIWKKEYLEDGAVWVE